MNKRNIPFAYAEKLFDVDVDFFVTHNVKVILSDFDNTLVPYGSTTPSEECLSYLARLNEKGIKVIIASNGLGKRVLPVAAAMGLEAVHLLRKPFAGPMKRLIKERGWNKDELMLVGDQIQTDVLAANGAGIRCLLVEPLAKHEPPWTKFNRIFDRPKRKKLKKKGLLPPWNEVA
ncbi:MAG: YqeG family HAD IIIA-type phosphatase [Bacilli bacterium]|nr:YqeG family HAD IIIA-type phosphatase [Bacilli bacterium]